MDKEDVKILVTGGAGFIGSHIVEHFHESAEVRILSRAPSQMPNLREMKYVSISGSILDRALIREAMRGVDYVFHLAALSGLQRSAQSPGFCMETNVNGTLILLEEAARANVRKLVFSSSAAVYGSDPAMPKVETMLPQPQSPYAISKLAGEAHCQKFVDENRLQTTSLRYFNVFGPRQEPRTDSASLVSIFIQRALKNEPLIIYGDGGQTRDFVYVKDVAAANVFFAMQSSVTGVFNIAAGQPVTINKLAAMICELTNSRSEIQHIAERPGDVRHSSASIEKAKAAGFTASSDLRASLKATVKSYQRNGVR